MWKYFGVTNYRLRPCISINLDYAHCFPCIHFYFTLTVICKQNKTQFDTVHIKATALCCHRSRVQQSKTTSCLTQQTSFKIGKSKTKNGSVGQIYTRRVVLVVDTTLTCQSDLAVMCLEVTVIHFITWFYIIFFFSNVTLCYEKWFKMTRLGGRHGKKSKETQTCLVAGKNMVYVTGSRICHATVKSSRGTTNGKIDLFQTSCFIWDRALDLTVKLPTVFTLCWKYL